MTLCPYDSYCPAGVSAAVSCKVCSANTIEASGGCPEGSQTDAKVCKCLPGFVGDGLKSGYGCSPCPANTYQDSDISQTCTACPRGAVSSPGSSGLLSCTCPPGYSGVSGGVCTVCPIGTYKSSAGFGDCTSCDPTFTTSAAGATAATSCICRSGYAGVASGCPMCPSGSYGPGGMADCQACKLCDPNAATAGSCAAGTGPSDPVVCSCNLGYNGDGVNCSSKPIPLPALTSVTPSSVFCLLSGQIMTIQVANFPAFTKQSVSIVWTLNGQTYKPADSRAFDIQITGDLEASSCTISLRLPPGPPNSQYGTSTFQISATLGSSLRSQFSFPLAFAPYFMGAPSVSFVYPTLVYTGSNLEVELELKNLSPISTTSSLTAVNNGATVPPSAMSLVQSNVDYTSLSLSLGVQAKAGAIILRLSTTDSTGKSVTTSAITIQVLEIPSPTILTNSLYPSSGTAAALVGAVRNVQLVGRYWPVGTTTLNVAVNMVTSFGAAAALEVVSVEQTNPVCLGAHCTSYGLTFLLPPEGNPDGTEISGVATVSVHVHGATVGSVQYKYISTAAATMEAVFPPSQLVTVAGTPGQTVVLYVKNFPSAGCYRTSCAADVKNGSLTLGFGPLQIPATILNWADSGRLLAITFLAPPSNSAEEVDVVANALSISRQEFVDVDFTFGYDIPAATVFPMDGSTAGGSLLTLTATGWGDLVGSLMDPSQVQVVLGDSPALVTAILDKTVTTTLSSITVTALAPASARAGTVSCWMGNTIAADDRSQFVWTYYVPPAIDSITPPSSTLGGFTGSADLNTIQLSISGLPAITSLSDVKVSFNRQDTGQPLPGSSIARFYVSNGQSYLTVKVPALSASYQSKANVSATITVQYPRDKFETRAASVSSFQYYWPEPRVNSIRWCQACNPGSSCLLNGKCGGGKAPRVGSAPLLQPGRFILNVDNAFNLALGAPQAVDESSTVSLSFLTDQVPVQSPLRTSSQSNVFGAFSTVDIEFAAPNFTDPSACANGRLALGSSSAQLPGFRCVDDRIFVSCKDPVGNNMACAGPNIQGNPPLAPPFSFILCIKGPFPISNTTPPLAAFGNSPTPIPVTVVSQTQEPQRSCLNVTTPNFISYDGVNMTVDLTTKSSDGQSTATTAWTFQKAPGVQSVRFDRTGTRIVAAFDQPTDRGGMAEWSVDCSLLAPQSIASLAKDTTNGPSCAWSTSGDQLVITLGPGATIVPGAQLALKGGLLRSANRLSPYMADLALPVLPPAILIPPTVTLVGPSTIDPCAGLYLDASGESPRPLRFAWACANDDGLNKFLSSLPPSTSSVTLSPGTSEMSSVDKAYAISVVATNFLGVPSTPAALVVTKKSASAPSFVFYPARVSIYRDAATTLSGVAQFSSCPAPQEDLRFTWSLDSAAGGPPSAPLLNLLKAASWQPNVFAGSSSLFLPPNTLDAGATYVFRVQLQVTRWPRLGRHLPNSCPSRLLFLPPLLPFCGVGQLKKLAFIACFSWPLCLLLLPAFVTLSLSLFI